VTELPKVIWHDVAMANGVRAGTAVLAKIVGDAISLL